MILFVFLVGFVVYLLDVSLWDVALRFWLDLYVFFGLGIIVWVVYCACRFVVNVYVLGVWFLCWNNVVYATRFYFWFSVGLMSCVVVSVFVFSLWWLMFDCLFTLDCRLWVVIGLCLVALWFCRLFSCNIVAFLLFLIWCFI